MPNRWDMFSPNEWNRLQTQLFDRLREFAPAVRGLAATYPAVNIWEDKENLYVEAELPGSQMDKMEIYVTAENELTIAGERKAEESENMVWHRQERGFGSFHRVIPLPADVNPDKVEARYENGVLLLSLPKAEHAKPKRIVVKGG